MDVEYTLLAVDNQVLSMWFCAKIKRMNNIEFNDDAAVKNSLLYSRFEESNKRPTLVNFLISKGITKSEKASNVVLLIISALFFLSAISVIYFFFYYTPAPSPEQINASSQALIMQKTVEYINQGMTTEEANQRATAEAADLSSSK